jgi:hypothetical protein
LQAYVSKNFIYSNGPEQEGKMVPNFKPRLIVISLLISILAISCWAMEPIEITVKTNQSEIIFQNQDGRSEIRLAGNYQMEISGEPLVPYKIVNIALPPDTRNENILTIGTDTISLTTITNYPWYRGDIKTDNSLQPRIPGRSEAIYNSNDYYPGYLYKILNQGEFAGQPILTLAVFPIQLIPSTGRLICINDIRIIIDLSIQAGNSPPDANPGSQVVQTSLINQEQFRLSSSNNSAPNWVSVPGTCIMGIGAEYLLITSNDLAADYYPYVVWKNQKGIVTELVIIDDILASYSGEDNAARLRAYLTQAHAAGTRWVLLGGDEDIIPIRYAFQTNVSKAPSLADQQVCDLYYGDLSGDWDYDGDGVYGETANDRPDLFPEIYVGRVPAENSEEVRIWVEKALLYEQNPGHGDNAYLTRALIISADQMRDLNEHIDLAAKLPADFFVDLTRCAEEPSGGSENPTQPTAETVISVMNEGWGLVTNLNHGNFYAYSSMAPNYNDAPRSYLWGDTMNPGDGASSLTRLTENDKYSIYYSFSCEVAGFDFDKNVVRPGPFITNHTFMEAYLFRPDRAGVAFLGNTRWGWVSASFRLEQKFLELVYSDSARNLGVAEALSKTFYPNYRDIDYGHNLFGDPEMTIWRNTPINLSVFAPAEIEISSPSLKVLATDGSGQVQGIKICIWKPGEMYYRGITDINGKVEIPLSLAKGGQVFVTATAPDCLPAIDTIIVRERVGVDNLEPAPGQFYLGNAYPNPFNSNTSIKFGSREQGDIQLDIFDLGGRKVRSLAEGNYAAGEHELKWDGRNDQGETVASGIYVYRLNSGVNISTKKMILLK